MEEALGVQKSCGQDALGSQAPPASQEAMAPVLQSCSEVSLPTFLSCFVWPVDPGEIKQLIGAIFCLGQKSPFSSIVQRKTTPLSTWWKSCKASSSQRAGGYTEHSRSCSRYLSIKSFTGNLHRQKIPMNKQSWGGSYTSRPQEW